MPKEDATEGPQDAGMISFAVERAAAAIPELKQCFDAHWRELALDQATVPLAPNYQAYVDADARGELLLMVGRRAGRLCAYYVGFIRPGLHYQTCLTAHPDIFWILPEMRNGTAGIRLFRAVEAELRRRGVRRWLMSGKIAERGGEVASRGRELREVVTDPSALFARIGAERIEVVYSKMLD